MPAFIKAGEVLVGRVQSASVVLDQQKHCLVVISVYQFQIAQEKCSREASRDEAKGALSE
jgi:hypothetical protein